MLKTATREGKWKYCHSICTCQRWYLFQISENCVNKWLELLHERDYGSTDNIDIYSDK